MNDYHLIFNLNGILVATSEGQTRTCSVVLKHGLNEFLSTYVKKLQFTYGPWQWRETFWGTWKKIGVHLLSSRIVNQSFYFKNDHFLLEKPNKLVFHKNLDFFVQFPSMMFENTLLIDTLHKSLFNPCFNAIFFEMFYRLHNDTNYLLQIVLPYLESLHLSRMWVYKFVKLNPFGSITKVLLDDFRYAKFIALCFVECDETFRKKVKSRFLNKKRWTIF